MLTTIKNSFGVMVATLALTVAFGAFAQPAYAADATECADDTVSLSNGANCAKGADQSAKLFGVGGVFTTITNVLLFIIGAISVIMLIIGGIRYTVSGGDQNAVTAAKNTILYAVIGLLVAIFAYAIVSFVVDQFI
jgi:glucose uptake protein GlcU